MLSRYWIEFCHKAAFAIIAFVVLLFLGRRHLHLFTFIQCLNKSIDRRASWPYINILLNCSDLISKQKVYYRADHANHLDDHIRASAAALLEFD